MVTSIPRKQRKLRFNAPLHTKQNMVSAHVSKELKSVTGKRTMRVKKGYSVKVLRGESKGKEGLVTRVVLKSCKIFVEGVMARKGDGKEVQIPVDPSNVLITKVNTDKKV